MSYEIHDPPIKRWFAHANQNPVERTIVVTTEKHALSIVGGSKPFETLPVEHLCETPEEAWAVYIKCCGQNVEKAAAELGYAVDSMRRMRRETERKAAEAEKAATQAPVPVAEPSSE